jgi:TolB-like protein
VPAAVAEAAEKALAIEPADRFPTAAEFRAALVAARRAGTGGLRTERLGLRSLGLAAGSLALAAIALTASRSTPGHRARLNPRRVAVAALSNETGDTTLAPLGSMIASWITDRLSRTPGVTVVTSAIVVPAQHDQHFAESDVDDPTRLHSLATETRAGTLVSGSYYRGIQGGVEFHVEITDANSGRLLRAIGPISGGGEPARAAGQLSAAVAAAVDTLVAEPGLPTR